VQEQTEVWCQNHFTLDHTAKDAIHVFGRHPELTTYNRFSFRSDLTGTYKLLKITTPLTFKNISGNGAVIVTRDLHRQLSPNFPLLTGGLLGYIFVAVGGRILKSLMYTNGVI
jgi:hypothetical protein